MELAGYRINTVSAGHVGLDGGAMFGIVPRPLWQRAASPDDQNRITLAMRCLLLQGHGRTILVDTGLGMKGDAKFQKIYAVDHEHSTLLGSLRDLGVAPEDVTDVILTHLHFDHAGGATTREPDGTLSLTFPRATHFVQHSHWEWAQVSPREQASFLNENLEPLETSGQLRLLDGTATPFPGISLVRVDGHTRGQQLPLITDGERSLFFAADLLPTAAHVAPLWIMAYDIEPLVTLREKVEVLDRAASEGWLVVFEHDPHIACGHVEATGSGYRAVETQPSLP